MLLIFSNCIKAQSDVDCLYDSLLYKNGICKKTIDVTYLSLGKNPISPGNENSLQLEKIESSYPYRVYLDRCQNPHEPSLYSEDGETG